MEQELVPRDPHEGRPDLPSIDQPKSNLSQSPFIEGTSLQWAWDATSLSAFKRCPRYYQYKIIEGWGGVDTPIHLRWGIEFHRALEDYDRNRADGFRHNDSVHFTVRELLNRIADWDPKPKTKSEELKTKFHLLRSVVWYLDHYNPDPAKTVILANGKPAVELNFCFEIFSPYSLCGYLDRVVEFAGDLYVMDRKSTITTPSSYYFDRYDLDEQMTVYNLAAQVLLKSPIKGVIVDVVQVAAGFTRPVRGFTYRTPDQVNEWLDHLRIWMEFAESCVAKHFWPMNLTSCDKYGGCEFRHVCSKSPAVRERFLKQDFVRSEPWNPLKPR
jgi:hypothetical protein